MTTSAVPSRFLASAVVMAALTTATVAADTDPIPMAAPESVGMSSDRLERIGVAMRRLIDAGNIPGTVTLVARHGKVVHFEANGMRDVAAGLPMEKDTIFRLYSQSKPVTGAAIMLLFEEGHFLMTDPVADYLPEFAEMEVFLGAEDGEVQTEPATAMTIASPPTTARTKKAAWCCWTIRPPAATASPPRSRWADRASWARLATT